MKVRSKSKSRDVENKYRLTTIDEGITLDNFNFLGNHSFLNTRNNKKTILRKKRNRRDETIHNKERDYSAANCNFN